MELTRRRAGAALVLGGGMLAGVGLLALWIIAPLLAALLTITGGTALAGSGWYILGRTP